MAKKSELLYFEKMIERLEKTTNDKLDMLHSDIKGLHEN